MSYFKDKDNNSQKVDVLLDAPLDGIRVLFETKSKGPRVHKNAVHRYRRISMSCSIDAYKGMVWVLI